MDVDHPVMRYVYIGMSAVAGAIVSLSQMRWQEMSWPDRWMALVVGVSFSLFGVPWIVGDLWNVDMTPLRVACGISFFGGVGAPVFIPVVLRWLKSKFGAGDIK